MLFDTHAHIDDEAFDSDRESVIEEISSGPVKCFVNIGSSIESSESSIRLTRKYKGIYAAVGIHPHDALKTPMECIEDLRRMSFEEKVVAIGEIGLDYYYDFSPRDVQAEWFKKQIRLANQCKLPFIVHSRDASQDTFDLIKEHNNNSRFVLHSYSQSAEMVKRYLDFDAYFSFSGVVTFKNANKIREAVRVVPLNRLLIETDSPYLTPVPLRGKRNNPSYVQYVAQSLAEILGMSYEQICSLTFENACSFFALSCNDIMKAGGS